MGKQRKRRRKPKPRPRFERPVNWHNLPQGKRVKLACGTEVMRVGGKLVEIPGRSKENPEIISTP